MSSFSLETKSSSRISSLEKQLGEVQKLNEESQTWIKHWRDITVNLEERLAERQAAKDERVNAVVV